MLRPTSRCSVAKEAVRTSCDALPNARHVLDVELWPVSDFNADLFIHRITTSLEQNSGTFVNTYGGSSALLMRVECTGSAVRALLELPEISSIDRPPTPDWHDLAASELTIGAVPDPAPAAPDAITIGIIDSGLTSAHPFLVGSLVVAFGEPAALGDSDEKGHGTPVSGIAAYGVLRQKLSAPPFEAKFRIASARVVNAEGRFDNDQLVPTQMDNSTRRCWESHLARARWMTKTGYRRILEQAAKEERRRSLH